MSEFTDALSRLATKYNGNGYDPSTNPGGLDNGGHTVNFVPALRDTSTVGTNVSTLASTAVASATTATNKATSATASAATATTKAAEAAASAIAVAANVNPLWLYHGVSPIGIQPTFQYRPGYEDVPSIVSVVRASTATRVNEIGLIEAVANNILRIDHDPNTGECLGALVEESRTNLLTYSEQFDNAVWAKNRSSVSANAAIAPDGTVTADKLIDNTTNDSHSISRSQSGLTLSSPYTYSMFAKAGERNWIAVVVDFDASFPYCFFDLSSGVIGVKSTQLSASITSCGNGWYRCSVTFTPTSTTSVSCFTLVTTGNNTQLYTGDGTSGLYIWGAQLEAGVFQTSYIPSSQTFTSRASTATYVGSDGLIKSAAINTARMGYTPNNLSLAPKMLLEGASTNLLTYSEDFTTWPKARTTVSSNAIAAPDGTTTADKLVEDTTASITHYIAPPNASVTAGNVYTFSVYAKSGTRTQVVLSFTGNLAGNAYFDLNSGSVILGTGQIVNVGNGWYRCSITAIASGTGSTTSYIYLSSNATGTYTGDGTSGLYIWGAQLETGYMTSYIPTTTAAVTRAADVSTSAAATRAADVVTVPVSAFPFNPLEGTLYATFDCPIYVTNTRMIQLDDGTDSNRCLTNITSGTSYTTVVSIGSNQCSISSGVVSVGTRYNLAAAFASNNCISARNGVISALDSSVIMPAGMTTMRIGGTTAGIAQICGHIRHVAYFPKRITNSNLQLLTA